MHILILELALVHNVLEPHLSFSAVRVWRLSRNTTLIEIKRRNNITKLIGAGTFSFPTASSESNPLISVAAHIPREVPAIVTLENLDPVTCKQLN